MDVPILFVQGTTEKVAFADFISSYLETYNIIWYNAIVIMACSTFPVPLT